MTVSEAVELWNPSQAYDGPVEVAPGILLVRIPLPIRLNHVNVYLFEEQDGWTIFDTGMNDDRCRETWEGVFADVIRGRPIKRLIVSHFHLDHVGLAGWIFERYQPAFYMSQSEYLLSRLFQSERKETTARNERFLIKAGLPEPTSRSVSIGRSSRVNLQTPVPGSFNRLRPGDTIDIGERKWLIMAGGGHAVEQIMLYCAKDKLFIAADQVLAEISPNVSVGALSPTDDPLGDFLRSLGQIKAQVANDALVLPGHRRPFYGLHARLAELQQHHESRCQSVLDACRTDAMTAYDLVPIVFERSIPTDVIGAAIGETIAHTNYLLNQKKLSSYEQDGITLYKS